MIYILILLFVLSALIQVGLSAWMRKYSKVEGTLTGHYNPATRTINLSEDVFFGKNITALTSLATLLYCIAIADRR